MIRRLTGFVSVVALLCLGVTPAVAQDPSSEAPPAHISFVDGAVVLERDGQSDPSPSSMPLLAGDRIRTQTGRAEILFADGSTLHVDHHTLIDFQSDEVVRLLDGRMRLSIAGQGRRLAYRVDAPTAWVEIAEAGEYRVAVLRGEREPQVELAVLRGAAELVNEDGRSLVRAGERAFVRAGARPSPPYVFNSAAWDAFDRWSEVRRDQRLGVSAQYLPSDVRPYAATFDNYGSWRYEQVHGYVWYPRVRDDWRPYYHGRWVGLRPYGWTWIAGDPWGWPTHHYGRWGVSAGAWFWIPGRRWGAAWVSWAHASDYVSWCPLGWNDRPVFSFINVYGARRFDHWRAWTVVPRRHFGAGYVNVHVVPSGRLDSRTRGSFVVRDRGPEGRYAVPRGSSPIRAAGSRTGYAIPRGSGTGAISAADAGRHASPGARSFPAPARQPRAPGAGAESSQRSSAPVTVAPQRAVPRDRGAAREGFSRADRAGAATAPGYRGSPESRDADRGRRADDTLSVPGAGSRAVPRRGDDAGPQRAADPEWRRSDRADRPARQAVPEYRRDPGERDTTNERYRAVPRQDAPRPSYEAPRGESPRSYGTTPRQESRPSSPGAGERRGPSSRPPAAEGRSRSGPSGDGGQSRSRGSQPSRGQAVRRPG